MSRQHICAIVGYKKIYLLVAQVLKAEIAQK